MDLKEPNNWWHEFRELLFKIAPFIVSVMAKIASDYKKNKRLSFMSTLVITCLAACGSIVGYWICKMWGWTEYKMTLTIFFSGLFADKFFEFLFSKTFLDTMFSIAEDWIKENLKFVLSRFKKD